jgi:hypothetical protein
MPLTANANDGEKRRNDTRQMIAYALTQKVKEPRKKRGVQQNPQDHIPHHCSPVEVSCTSERACILLFSAALGKPNRMCLRFDRIDKPSGGTEIAAASAGGDAS